LRPFPRARFSPGNDGCFRHLVADLPVRRTKADTKSIMLGCAASPAR
jgi:hypothetical protein